MVNLLIIDRSAAMGRLMATALRNEPELNVVAVTTGWRLALARWHHCDVVAVSAVLAGEDPCDVIRTIARECPGTKIVVMDVRRTDDTAGYLGVGAHELVYQEDTLQDFMEAVRRPITSLPLALPLNVQPAL